MDKLTKQIIKCKIMQYPHLKIKIADDIADVCEKGASNNIRGGRSSVLKVSGFDDKLTSIMSNEDYLWCDAIESSVDYFKDRGQEDVIKAVDGLYWKGGSNADGVAYKLHISRATVYNLIDSFMETAHKFALKKGLVFDI